MKSLPILFIYFLLIPVEVIGAPPTVAGSSIRAERTGENYRCLLQQAPPYDSLRGVLEAMYDSDQGVRQNFSSTDGEQSKRMQKVDSANQVQIGAILQQYGWLPKSKVGQKASDAIFFVVQHSNAALMKQYLPVLQELAQQKEASSIAAAMMEDRLLMWEGKKQVYGTQGYGTLTRATFIWPIRDPAKVNQLRKQAGFDQTLEEYAKQLNATYDPNEKLPPAIKR